AVVAKNSTFEEIAIIHGTNAILTGEGAPERLGVVRASSNLYSILGAKPALGRVFLPEEDVGEKATTVILSYGLWQQRFGGDPNVLGRALTLNGDSFTVVGVMSQDFSLGYEVVPTVGSVEQADLLPPLPMTAESFSQQGVENYNMLARLKPGVTIQQAQSELHAVRRGRGPQYPGGDRERRRFIYSA